ncbi:MAG: glycosyltransferase family 4 protein [Nitrospiraceae bacterium]|nr:glycosyltransferase family 4 protein [Nitrospiraceae bacterium]
MILVAYDHQIFSWQKYGGISRYFYEISSRIQKLDNYKVKILAPLYVNRYLKDNPLPYVVGLPFPWIPKSGRAMQIINAPVVRCLLHRKKPDLVHETYFYEKKLSPIKSRTVITVHDMICEKFSQYCRPSDKMSQIKKEAVKRADHIICVSENTRKDMIELLGVEFNRTSVVYHGCAIPTAMDTDLLIAADRPYIAYVGLRGGYKNFSKLLHAYSSSDFLKNNFAIICFGGGQFSSRELKEISDLKIPLNAVIHLDGDDSTLARIYKQAEIFVYPSLYEGFGFPPLEAMSFGCPVACSHTSSMPEVCGSAAEYFDPYDIESIQLAVEKVVSSPSRRNELVLAGYTNVHNFSWDKCAKETAEIYKSLL